MKAVLKGCVIADADDSDLVRIEGNWYFPPASIVAGTLLASPTPYTCYWKGVCQYYSLQVGGELHIDHAWSYPDPFPAACDRVGRDFSGYVAFAPGVEIVA